MSVVANATCLTVSDRGPRNSSWQRAECTPVVSCIFEHHVGDSTTWLCSSPVLRESILEVGDQGPPTNLTRGIAARRLFRVPPCRTGTIHVQTSLPSPGFEPRSYCTTVGVTNHYTNWAPANNNEQPNHFDRGVVVQQIRALQVLETVNLMAGGFPHRMRFKAFNIRYRLIAPFKKLKRTDDKAVEDCKLILECFMAVTENCRVSNASTAWAMGKRHIFLSEGSRQQLELLRVERRHNAAVLIQAVWRGWNFRRKRWPTLKRNLHMQARTRVNRPRPQPIAGTPPPDLERCDQKTIQQTCSLFGLDLERPPPVPPSRSYTVTGNTKMGYPQARVMKMNYPEDNSGEVTLHKGETVMVVRASARRGHLVVEHKNHTIHVPYQFLELKPSEGVNI
ncbi:myosin-I heavy chain [Trichonephila clavipes]|nr:myosin-I heavy chain [Trichonephila clavipes]